jgi:hypothetical protein
MGARIETPEFYMQRNAHMKTTNKFLMSLLYKAANSMQTVPENH